MSRKVKRIIVASSDISVILLAASFSIFFLLPFINFFSWVIAISIGLTCISYLTLGHMFNLFSKINHCTGLSEVLMIIVNITLSFFLSNTLSMYFIPQPLLSLRFYFLTYILSVIGIVGTRLIIRFYYEYRFKSHSVVDKTKVRTLVVGAGNGGSLFIKSLKSFPNKIEVVRVVDDDVTKQGTLLYGAPIKGTIKDIPQIIKLENIEQVTIAIPSLSPGVYEEIVDLCNELDVIVNKMPYIEDVLQGRLEMKQFRDINLVDLLGRAEVKLDMEKISEDIENKTILVSGAGGSIGSEICRQVMKFSPKSILLLGHGENSIYEINKQLIKRKNITVKIVPIIADIQDRKRMFEIMGEYKPDIVYHAAAHKHVPMMEINPHEAVKNNIYGTKNIAEASRASNVEKFIMISTDKAVNPPNVMGATKKIAEMIVTGLNQKGQTRFAAVRFGNVLGSRGSVVPLFQEQIKNGGPLTVTDFRMTRYFMTIPEASRLVIQASTLLEGGEVFVLDMGEPVKILDLAKKVVKLSGYTEEEIAVVETGIRPGEKLFEELLVDNEQTNQKVYDKIFVGKVVNKPLIRIMSEVDTWDMLDSNQLKKQLIMFANDMQHTGQNENELAFNEKESQKRKEYQNSYARA